MNDHQHAAIEQARIAWHGHQFEHDCYGRDCAEDGRLYRAYRCAISGDLPGPGRRPGRRPRGRFLMSNPARAPLPAIASVAGTTPGQPALAAITTRSAGC